MALYNAFSLGVLAIVHATQSADSTPAIAKLGFSLAKGNRDRSDGRGGDA